MPEVRGGSRWQVWWQVRWRWQLDMAMWVAVRYGNEELVASLMAECDGKNEGKRIWVAKGVATLHGKNWAGNLVISFWWQRRCQNLMAVFWAEKIHIPYMTKEVLSVHGTCWQKGNVERRGVRDILAANGLGSWWPMAKVLVKFWATLTREREREMFI